MRYFETLPIFDNKYRNIFKKVSLSFIREDQLIKYQMDDFESLPIVSEKFYKNHEYWWVIALLNDIYDINFDVPYPDSQANIISMDIAKNKYFDDGIVDLGINKVDAGSSTKGIAFTNTNNSEYIVLLSLFNNSFIDVNLSYEQINIHNFVVSIDNIQGSDVNFAYCILRKPILNESTDLSYFSDIYDKLTREVDLKREIYLLKREHILKFIAEYQLALRNQQLISLQERYLSEGNLLKKDFEREDVDYGVLVDFYDNIRFGGSNYYRQINTQFYEYDFVSLLSCRSFNDVGSFAVKQRVNLPRVYNNLGKQDKFDIAIFSKEAIKNTLNSKIFDVGVTDLTIGENIITFENIDSENEDESRLIFFPTPIINTASELTNITPISFTHNSLDSIKVYVNSDFKIGWVVLLKEE